MRAPKVLRRTQFGNPLLRTPARKLSKAEVTSAETQQLIADMFYTLENKKMGVALAATQVGQLVAIMVIGVKKTPARPNVEPIDMVVINPIIVKTYGPTVGMWEGCLSFAKAFAKARRHKKIRLRYIDEHGSEHEADFDGFLAHVLQHETDHLNGILFVDRVKDSKTWMTEAEYIKMRNKETKDAKVTKL